MFDRIGKTLGAGALAAGIAFGAVAPAPAMAGNDDALRIIGGIVALGLIAKALEDDDPPAHAYRQQHIAPFGHAYQPDNRALARAHRAEAERQEYLRQQRAQRAHQHRLEQDRLARQQWQAERAHQRQVERARENRAPRTHRPQPGQSPGAYHGNQTDRTAQRLWGFPPGTLISPNH